MRSLVLVASMIALVACGQKREPDGTPVEVRATNGSAYDEGKPVVGRLEGGPTRG